MRLIGLILLLVTLPFCLLGIVLSFAIFTEHPFVAAMNLVMGCYWPYAVIARICRSGGGAMAHKALVILGALLFDISFAMHAFELLPLIFGGASLCLMCVSLTIDLRRAGARKETTVL